MFVTFVRTKIYYEHDTSFDCNTLSDERWEIMAEKTGINEMIRTLADFPEDMRKKMILDRLRLIAAEPEGQRVKSVKAMILAVSTLDSEKKMEFVRTLANALVEAPPQVRQTIQIARLKAGTQVSEEVNQSEMMNILEAYMEWPKEKHQMFVDNLAGVFLILCPQLRKDYSMECSLDWL